jgi:hypothetical protein
MARNENQGLQIAVILFTMLTVGLSISTYVYFQSYTTEFEKRNQAVAEASKSKETDDKQVAKIAAFQYILGIGSITEPQIKEMESKFDEETKKAVADFQAALEGNNIQFTDTQKGILVVPPQLITQVDKRNEIILSEKDNVKSAESETKKHQDEKVKEVDAAVTAKSTAETKLAEQIKIYSDQLTDHKKKLDELKADLARKTEDVTAKEKKHQEEIQKLTQTISAIEKEREIWKNKYVTQVVKVGPQHESPDGEVTWVNQRERLVWIDLGYADGLSRQITFTVHDHDQSGVASAVKKGRVEVVRILEPHLAECRILEDSTKNPILPGDKLFTPAWSPGQRLRFALTGFFDIDGDGRSDREEVRNIILMNGGLIDAEQLEDGKRLGEISHETRYLVRGKQPSERELTGDAGKKAFQTYQEMIGQAEKKEVERIDIVRFLSMMGWKSQEKTVVLGQKRGVPVTKKAAADDMLDAPAGKSPTAAPAEKKEAKPAAATDDDPFAS